MQASYLWKKLFTKKHLIEHYEEKVKNKLSVGLDKVSPRKFEQNLDENIEIIIRKSMNDSYHFTRYKQLLFTKGPAKLPRAICVPTLRDKLTASVLNELLVGVYGDKCKTMMPQLVIDDITKKIPMYTHFIKLDVKSFYGSINHDKLIKIIKRKIHKAEIISIIWNAIRTEALLCPIKEKTVTLSDVDDEKKLECNNVIVEWLERTAESPNEKVSISSIFMLAAKYIQMEKYKEANIFLDKIPDTVIDATIMKTNVLAHQEGTDIAAFFLEGKLMQTVTNIQNYLYKLIEMEEETGNHCKAEEIAEITEHMVSLFGLWDYGKVVPYLLIAVYRKDVEKCIQLIKEVLMESKKPWKMVESPLYYRYVDTVQGKSFSGVGNNFVHALATEIENKEEYEFLKGNKELEAIFSQYLK